ncbi:MAG: hypothetical protein GY696_36080 [Gammaproteobacteria bacterium]|nr:hypothetical protein [Gammaproteobacteria bacterium]
MTAPVAPPQKANPPKKWALFVPKPVKEDDTEIQINGHTIKERDAYLINRCQRSIGLIKNNVEPRVANIEVKVCALLNDLAPAIEGLTQQNVWLTGQNNELWAKMNQVTFWKQQTEREKEDDKRLIDKCTETMHSMYKVMKKLKDENEACTEAITKSNNYILQHQLTRHIEKQKNKIPATVTAPAVNMMDNVPSTSTDPPPVFHTNSEDVDMYSEFDSSANTLVNTGYDPEYPQCNINSSLATNDPTAYAAPISSGDFCTPPPNSPQEDTGREWNQQVTDQIDLLDNQVYDHHPTAILELAPAATPPPTPPALQVRATRKSK